MSFSTNPFNFPAIPVQPQNIYGMQQQESLPGLGFPQNWGNSSGQSPRRETNQGSGGLQTTNSVPVQPRSTYLPSMARNSLGGSGFHLIGQSPPRRETNQGESPVIGGFPLPNFANGGNYPSVMLPGQSPRRDIPQGSLPVTGSYQSIVVQEPADQLAQQSYETLVKQLYGLPVTLPESLIVNGLRLEFIPFSQLNSIQIDRYIIEPLLQPWAGPPSSQNRILTIFGKNGMTYLVKAMYNQATNKIFPPV